MSASAIQGPRHIVCLTEETTETLYLLAEQQRIAGIPSFTVRPPRARREKPKVSAFTGAKIDKSADVLQPGPAALGDGLAQIYPIIQRWADETRP